MNIGDFVGLLIFFALLLMSLLRKAQKPREDQLHASEEEVEAQHRMVQELLRSAGVDVSKQQKPKPAKKRRTPPPPPSLPIAQRRVLPEPTFEFHDQLEGRQLELHVPSAPSAHPQAPAAHISRTLRGVSMRDAMILKEILGPPVSTRDPTRQI